jgi:alpha-glucoside transport system permease protein
MSSGSVATVPPAAPVPSGGEPGRWRKYALAAGFLAPAVVFLAVWIVYPTVYTIVRSFYGRDGFNEFVGVDNYKTLFTTDVLVTAIKNNMIWLAVVPAFVTALGLIFGVLTERVRWSVAFKTVVFMPMAISAFAAGVTWRIMYVQDPDLGAVNAGLRAIDDTFSPSGSLPDAAPSSPAVKGTPKTGIVSVKAVSPGGDPVPIGLTRIRPSDVPPDAKQAVVPEPLQGGITGVVWRDFKPGGGKPGVVEQGELGLPRVTVELRDAGGKSVATTKTEDNGTFKFEDVADGSYRAGVSPATFAQPFEGVSWLGADLITPSIIIAYIWIWAGFAMVVIAAGLSALPRDVLEAARTDGATEWQVFRRVTVPLLAPVLTVVFITMLINVLKVFDIVISVAPGSVQDDANVLALAMWRTSFGGTNNFGVGSAIAVFIFILVIPLLALNVRRFRREQ